MCCVCVCVFQCTLSSLQRDLRILQSSNSNLQSDWARVQAGEIVTPPEVRDAQLQAQGMASAKNATFWTASTKNKKKTKVKTRGRERGWWGANMHFIHTHIYTLPLLSLSLTHFVLFPLCIVLV